MVEAIAGGLVGALLALLGTYLVVRDTRRGREMASEEKAAAALLAQLRRARFEEPGDTIREYTLFTEECLTSVLSFRDARVRKRLTASVDIIARARFVARQHDAGWMSEETVDAAFRDVREVLEARLDRARRLPKPSLEWLGAAGGLAAHFGALSEMWADLEEADDEERMAFNYRMAQEEDLRRATSDPAGEPGS